MMGIEVISVALILIVCIWSFIVLYGYQMIANAIIPVIYILPKNRIWMYIIGMAVRTAIQVVTLILLLLEVLEGNVESLRVVQILLVTSIWVSATCSNHQTLLDIIHISRYTTSSRLDLYLKAEGTLVQLEELKWRGRYCYRKSKDTFVIYYE